MRRILFVLTLLLMVMLPVHAQSDYEPIFEETDCLFTVANITCGVLTVPEDRSDPQGNQVELAVAIIHSNSSNPAPDPVIYLEGGPGGWGIESAEDLQKLPILDSRDVIVFDQRGTGLSYPSLNCPEVEENGDTQACHDRLVDEGVNLDMYNSANSAADVNDLRIALGYDSVNLYGISYGTKLALITMRDYPEGIRSVVIDLVYPPEIDDLGLTATSFTDALNNLFERCADDPDCSDALPDLETTFFDMVDTLNQSPQTLQTDDGEVELSGDEVLSQMFLALYDSNRIRYLPYAIYLLANGQDESDLQDGYDLLTGAWVPDDTSEPPPSAILDSPQIQDYVDQYGDIDDSEGMNLSFDCSEEYQLNDVDAARNSIALVPDAMQEYFQSNIDGTLADCAIWDVQTADAIEAERVISDIPTLVVSGMFDPVTPPSSGESAAEGLSNSQFIIFPTAGHGITFTDSTAGTCAKQLVVSFLDSPSAQLDTSCVAATDSLEFYLGE